MSDLQIRDVSEAVLTSMTEEECANWRHEQGKQVICHRGRYWEELRPGFYQPIHLLARLSTEQATSPAPLGWGFRAALYEDEAATANGSIAVHLLLDVEGYHLHSLSNNRRKHIRKCYKLVKIVELTGCALLEEQGYETFLSARTRTAYAKKPSREKYLASLKDYATPGRRLVIAGLINGRLGGYLTGYAVDGIAYMEDRIISTEALRTDISSGLTYEFVQICRRSAKIRHVVSGQHCREDAALCVFKEGMGFPVKHIPAKVQMNPIIKKFIRWLYPDKYYRLTGTTNTEQVSLSKGTLD